MNANKLSVKMYDSYCILMFSCYYENIPFDVFIPYVDNLTSNLFSKQISKSYTKKQAYGRISKMHSFFTKVLTF